MLSLSHTHTHTHPHTHTHTQSTCEDSLCHAFLLQTDPYVEMNTYWCRAMCRIFHMQEWKLIHTCWLHPPTHLKREGHECKMSKLPFMTDFRSLYLLLTLMHECTSVCWHKCTLVILTGICKCLLWFRYDCSWIKSIVFSITESHLINRLNAIWVEQGPTHQLAAAD